MWSTLANSKEIKIITSRLLTNLTIVNVTKSDFGKYRLFIEHAVGIFEQIFYIAAKAPPDKSSDFKVIEERTTDTSVTVKWKPGLNHGSDQHFMLQYKKVTDDEWISINVTHNNGSTISYTI
ncbi:uncharacterized protein LOC128552287 [Mercenaria mercenaria]|uniref:uncharacterized protein LOC128552287 n=1 Tax=Mercenaria mercenaria TaxID=6596 RepID=UPI00234ED615|nr:uncharacterized protein LOC128552287 [Mercenaria mercenaria]